MCANLRYAASRYAKLLHDELLYATLRYTTPRHAQLLYAELLYATAVYPSMLGPIHSNFYFETQ